jgi:DnaJ-class molecular chaperone with C-terminal Zn finger domain
MLQQQVVMREGESKIVTLSADDSVNFYDILGVPENATVDEIKAAYFGLVRRYRPTEHPEEFQRYSAASRTLTDPRRRNEYDQMRRAGKRIQVLVDQAAAAADKDPQKAMTLLKSAIAIAPDSPRPRLLLAHVMMRIDEYAVAEKQYRWLLKELPGDETLHFKLARCLWLQDRADEAEAELVQAVKINPRYHDAHMLLSRMYEKAGKYALAVYALEKAIENDGVEDYADVDALLRLLVLYLHMGNGAEAERTSQRLLRVTPQTDARLATRAARRMFLRARDLYDEGDFRVANEVLQVALRLNGVEEPFASEIQNFARTVVLTGEARQVIKDDLLRPSLRLMAQVRYLEKGTEAQRRVRMGEVAENIQNEILQDARQVMRSIEYLRREYQVIATDLEPILAEISSRAQRRLELIASAGATGGSHVMPEKVSVSPVLAPESAPTPAATVSGDAPADRPAGEPRPKTGLLGWLRGGKKDADP